MSIIVNGIELTEVIYAGVNLDIVKVKKGAAEAVTVFEKITQLATPQNVTVDGTTVSWDEVENATSYEVIEGGNNVLGTVTPSYKVTVTINETSVYARNDFTVYDGDIHGKVLYSNTTSSGNVPSPQTFDITSGKITFHMMGKFVAVTDSGITGLEFNTAASVTNTLGSKTYVYNVLGNGTVTLNVEYDG